MGGLTKKKIEDLETFSPSDNSKKIRISKFFLKCRPPNFEIENIVMAADPLGLTPKKAYFH